MPLINNKTQHTSCGGILFDNIGEKVYLIYSPRDKAWKIPKGHIKEGESLLETAIREVSEETGYTSIFPIKQEPMATIEYDFAQEETPGIIHHKIVYFFAFKVTDMTQRDGVQEEGENLGGDWIEIEGVVDKLLFENEKEVAKKVFDNVLNTM